MSCNKIHTAFEQNNSFSYSCIIAINLVFMNLSDSLMIVLHNFMVVIFMLYRHVRLILNLLGVISTGWSQGMSVTSVRGSMNLNVPPRTCYRLIPDLFLILSKRLNFFFFFCYTFVHIIHSFGIFYLVSPLLPPPPKFLMELWKQEKANWIVLW